VSFAPFGKTGISVLKVCRECVPFFIVQRIYTPREAGWEVIPVYTHPGRQGGGYTCIYTPRRQGGGYTPVYTPREAGWRVYLCIYTPREAGWCTPYCICLPIYTLVGVPLGVSLPGMPPWYASLCVVNGGAHTIGTSPKVHGPPRALRSSCSREQENPFHCWPVIPSRVCKREQKGLLLPLSGV